MMKFSCGFSTFSFIFGFRNGLYWVANVCVIGSKTCMYCIGGIFLKSEISHFMIVCLLGFCKIKYLERVVSKGILRSTHVTRIL